MKTILFFCLLSIAAFAQKVASPPTLTYRQSNTNELNMIVSSAGQLLTPSSSMSITAEIRASDVGRIITTVSLSTVSSQDGTIKGILPDLAPNIYYLGLFVDYANGQPDFRVGVARIEILPTGSLRSITDASGLNVQISETKQVLDIKLDATPSASVAAYYAQQAKNAVRDSLSAFALMQDTRDDGQDTQISARVTLTNYNTNRANDLSAIALKANSADVYSKTQSDALYKPISFTPTWSALPDKPSLFSGSYADLTNKPTIPTSASQVGAYSTAQVDNLLITKVEYTSRASYASMLTITPLPNTIIIVYVDYDEKHSMPNQEYKILPSGKRTWAAQIEDN